MKKIGVVIIRGGLGNQIFALNLINHLESNKYTIYTSLNFYNKPQVSSINTEKRFFHFNVNNLKLKITNNRMDSLISKFQKIMNSKSPLKYLLKIFVTTVNDENYLNEIRKNKLIFIFDGYWQNYELLTNKKNLLTRISKDSSFNELNRNIQINKKTVVHIRRKDYLNINEDLSISYYEKALDYCKKNIKNFTYTIYTDDLNWTKKMKLFNDAQEIVEAQESNTVSDFLEMMKYKNFVISNSTYSYLAAYFGLSQEGIVICPKPWFKNLKYIDYDKIINKDWVLIEND